MCTAEATLCHSIVCLLRLPHFLAGWVLDLPVSPLKVKKSKRQLSLVWLFATPWTVAHQPPLSTGFFRQKYWSRLPFPSPGDLSDPGLNWEDNRQEGQGSPKGGNRLQVSDIFSLLSGRRKQVLDFFPSLYKFKEVSLKILCCHNETWFHLNFSQTLS